MSLPRATNVIRLLEALNFRCLRYVRQELGPFQVLVGPNAGGKTTFLDVVAFLGRLVSAGPEAAVGEWTQNFDDLLWGHRGQRFELAIEVTIPEDRRKLLPKEFDTIRYEVVIGRVPESGEVGILEEYARLKRWSPVERPESRLFPMPEEPPATVMAHGPARDGRRVLTKSPGGNDNFYSEVLSESGKGWFPSIRPGPRTSALATVPQDESRFPVSTWLRAFLRSGVQKLVLNSLLIRKASPPPSFAGSSPTGRTCLGSFMTCGSDPRSGSRAGSPTCRPPCPT